jgi:serine/threonine-protein kinase RsbT
MAANAIRVERLSIASSEDIVLVRQSARKLSLELGFGLVDQTKIVTAASELARNTLIHGRGGFAQLEVIQKNGRPGLRMSFEDQGPGIADIEKALQDGFSTGGGLGLGLGGARRLTNEFEIWSERGKGTRVTIVKWKA